MAPAARGSGRRRRRRRVPERRAAPRRPAQADPPEPPRRPAARARAARDRGCRSLGERPPAINRSRMPGSWLRPIRMTNVPFDAASQCQSTALRLRRILVAGDDRQRRGELAMGHRDARAGRSRQRRGDARHHLDWNSRGDQRRNFAAATEDVGVAALEPDDVPSARARAISNASISCCSRAANPRALPAKTRSAAGGASATSAGSTSRS